MNTTIIIAKLKTIHWIILEHGIKNGLYILCNRYNTIIIIIIIIIIKMFIST